MKRLLVFFLVLTLFCPAALADPLPLLEDYSEDIAEPYDETDPSAGTFVYSYRYPHVDETAEGGSGINVFYLDLIDYDLGFTVPFLQDSFEGYDSSTVITYEITCNNDDYFSVLVRKEENNPDTSRVYWTGNVFARKNGGSGTTTNLPRYLGILETASNDTWLEDRQTAKADKLVREMVWDRISDTGAGIPWYPDFTEEELSHVFFPEEDFYLDETGNPVFFLQPGVAAPEDAGLLVFPIPLEDILDEL